MSASPHVCVRCAAQGTSCCVSAEGVSGPPLTPGDLQRIAAASGLAPEAFSLEREIDAVEQAAWEADDPAARGLVREGRVRSLARRGADCVFLGDAGCTLGSERPLLCQRFPFVRRARAVAVKPGGYCLAVEEAGDLGGLLVLLGSSRARLRAIDAQLEKELGR